MINAEQQQQWFKGIVDKAERPLPGEGLVWLQGLRQQAEQSIGQLPVLDRSQEAWRYSRIDELFKQRFDDVDSRYQASKVIDMYEYLYPAYESYRLVFVNGRHVPQLASLPTGIRISGLHDALVLDEPVVSQWFEKNQATSPQNVFTALNTALMNDGVFIHLDSQVELDRPIEVLYINQPGEASKLSQYRNLVLLDKGAKATLIEHFINSGDSLYFNNCLMDISLADSANLQHYRVQDESQQAFHLSQLSVSLSADSRYQSQYFAFGAHWSRTEYHVKFEEKSAESLISGLYLVADQQFADVHLNVQHQQADCRSRENFKGILYGKGRAVFDGQVRVEPNAQLTDAQLSNDNLLLSRDAEVDCKPQLEIYADNVKCSHGTTVGQIDPLQLYYLRCRGIGLEMARNMLCHGFARELINQIELPLLREQITDRLTDCLQRQKVPDGSSSWT